MKIVSAENMRKIDLDAINDFGIPSIMLMETAGMCCFKAINENYGKNIKIFVVCGKGNNGGDGLVIARLLKKSGYDVKAVLPANESELSQESKTNYRILKRQYPNVIEHVETSGECLRSLDSSQLIVDALLGTGISKEVTGMTAEMINLINSSGKDVLSVDVPSGINCNTGQIMGCAIKANFTVTIGAAKQGLLLHPGSEYSGKIYIADIGFPELLLNSPAIKCSYASAEELCAWLPQKQKNAQKNSNGRLLIIAGSKKYTGAPYLSSLAAMKSGAGLVYLAVPEEIHGILASKLNEAIIIPYQKDSIEKSLGNIIPKTDAMLIGPGIGLAPQTHVSIKKIISENRVPAVIDADALQKEILTANPNGNFVITPHAGEMARILKTEPKLVESDRIFHAQKAAESFNTVTILKGPNSIISAPSGQCYFNTSGNEAMASAGMGDALAGITAAVLAKGGGNFEAAVLSAFIHGAAGDMAAKNSSYGITATDLIEKIPCVIDAIAKKDLQLIESMQQFKNISVW